MSHRSAPGDNAVDAKRRRTGDALPPDVGWPIDDEATARRKLEGAGFHLDRVSEEKVLLGATGFNDRCLTTPMIYFCHHGDLPMCRYLFIHGAAEDVTRCTRRECGDIGSFPMHAAAARGHVEVCQWLFEHGAAMDVSKANFLCSVLHRAAAFDTYMPRTNRENLCRWLILKGALSTDASGHIDLGIMRRDLVPPRRRIYNVEVGTGCDVRPSLLSWAQDAVQVHANFFAFLMGTLSLPDFSVPSLAGLLSTKLGSETAARVILESTPSKKHQQIWDEILPKESPLCCFNGLPGIMEKVADFVGVMHGRDLRTARGLVEKMPILLSLFPVIEEESDNDDDEWSSDSDDDDGADDDGADDDDADFDQLEDDLDDQPDSESEEESFDDDEVSSDDDEVSSDDDEANVE